MGGTDEWLGYFIVYKGSLRRSYRMMLSSDCRKTLKLQGGTVIGCSVFVNCQYTHPDLNDNTNHRVKQNCQKVQEWLQAAMDATEASIHDKFSEECSIGDEDYCWQ
jgi:hypothetical protein